MQNRTPHADLKWLSVADVAKDLGLSRQGALNKVAAGQIPGAELLFITEGGKRRWRVDATAYFAWRELMRAENDLRKQPMRPLVYFIQAEDEPDGPVKIGFSSDHYLGLRLATLQIGNPKPLRVLATIDGGQAKEFALHNRFRSLRIRGEWFAMNDELRALIEEARTCRA